MQMPPDSAEKMNSLSVSDESPQLIQGGTSTSGSDVTAPYLILCFGSGIGITLVWRDRTTFHCSDSTCIHRLKWGGGMWGKYNFNLTSTSVETDLYPHLSILRPHASRYSTNGASLAWRLRRRISTLMFTCGWACRQFVQFWAAGEQSSKMHCLRRRWTAV